MALEQKLTDRASAFKALKSNLKKYRLPALATLLGIGILILPGREYKAVSASDAPPPLPTETEQHTEDTERRLEDILRCVSGAGRVRVMLTQKHSGLTTYQSDSDVTQSDGSTNTRTQTVFRSDGSYQQTPLITMVSSPEYLGAVVVCSGGDDPDVRLRIVKAVCSLTGLGSDQVTVLKMEGL